MKIPFNHLKNYCLDDVSIEEVSKSLFQLGHEHEIIEDIIDIEITPNRGDCLSVKGILRDLSAFHKIKFLPKKYEGELNKFNIDFENLDTDSCPRISFLKIDISNNISAYKNELKNYFDDLDVNKNNFFTDVSNYIMYETGQPTHCYDAKYLKDKIILSRIQKDTEFQTLLDSSIELNNQDLVFYNNERVINLAGVMGGKDTACSDNTRSVVVECAYFIPEVISGKSIKYDIKSDAAYRFERGVDSDCHEEVLRRFINIVSDHTNIKRLEFVSFDHKKFSKRKIKFNTTIINKILGTDISDIKYKQILENFSFSIKQESICIPSFRNDIETNNDLAEEVARFIGYNNISSQELSLPNKNFNEVNSVEIKIKSLMTDYGYLEVINSPFVEEKKDKSLIVDNPLDSSKKFLRTNLKKSLIANLIFNERRQKDSIKLFEIADVYFLEKNKIQRKRKIGIIASGRVDKNYKDFAKIIDINNITSFLDPYIKSIEKIGYLSRDNLDSKSKFPIIYYEASIEDFNNKILNYEQKNYSTKVIKQYKEISEKPFSIRDLSYSLLNSKDLNDLQNVIFSQEHKILKDIFIFDFFVNKEKNEIKIGFRFTFQAKKHTVTDIEIDEVITEIIKNTISIESVTIPGLSV